jgi:hypothetical protein
VDDPPASYTCYEAPETISLPCEPFDDTDGDEIQIEFRQNNHVEGRLVLKVNSNSCEKGYAGVTVCNGSNKTWTIVVQLFKDLQSSQLQSPAASDHDRADSRIWFPDNDYVLELRHYNKPGSEKATATHGRYKVQITRNF